jgi:hypothetical protein
MSDVRALWGVWPQCEFNITQLMDDQLLLEALHAFFDSQGGVYSRKNNVGTVSFRKLSLFKNSIIPFFLEYPLLGLKSYEFERWVSLVELLDRQAHISSSLSGRDALIEFAILCKELNSKRNNPRKVVRCDVIVTWLKGLTELPSLEAKLALKVDILEALNDLKSKDSD